MGQETRGWRWLDGPTAERQDAGPLCPQWPTADPLSKEPWLGESRCVAPSARAGFFKQPASQDLARPAQASGSPALTAPLFPWVVRGSSLLCVSLRQPSPRDSHQLQTPASEGPQGQDSGLGGASGTGLRNGWQASQPCPASASAPSGSQTDFNNFPLIKRILVLERRILRQLHLKRGLWLNYWGI